MEEDVEGDSRNQTLSTGVPNGGNINYSVKRCISAYNESISRSSSSTSSSASSNLECTYSVNSASEYAFTVRSIEKSRKRLSHVQQMRLKFENISGDEKLKAAPKTQVNFRQWRNTVVSQFALDEIPSEDEAPEIPAEVEVAKYANRPLNRRNKPKAPGVKRVERRIVIKMTEEKKDDNGDRSRTADKRIVDASRSSDNVVCSETNNSPARFSEPPRRRKISQTRNRHVMLKSHSCYQKDENDNNQGRIQGPAKLNSIDDCGDSQSLEKQKTCQDIEKTGEPEAISLVVRELIKTEQTYVRNLKLGIEQYSGIFTRKSLPATLRGKNFILFGNIDQIADFHETQFLPMLQRNQDNVEKLCEEFLKFIEDDYFYTYVLYTINKTRSEKLCIQHREFLFVIQTEIGDKLGINSFLVQPVQRLPRYQLLLNEMLAKYFKTDPIKHKNAIAACCRVEKSIRRLLDIVNEALQINSVEDCQNINLLYQGHFKKCDDFMVYDSELRRTYRSKVFIFDKCIAYTEILKDNRLQFRGFYPVEYMGFVMGKKSFTLYYHKRKNQECEFSADQTQIDLWIELIRDIAKIYADDERKRLMERYSNCNEVYRRPGSIHALRNSHTTASKDSGIFSLMSNISNSSSNENTRTTWYAVDKLVPTTL